MAEETPLVSQPFVPAQLVDGMKPKYYSSFDTQGNPVAAMAYVPVTSDGLELRLLTEVTGLAILQALIDIRSLLAQSTGSLPESGSSLPGS